MSADFLDAHQRHYEDAMLLFGASRWANADHLCGIAAECGLKGMMIAFGMPVQSNSGAPQKKGDRVHADEAWDRYEHYRSGHIQGANYILPSTNAFQDWNVSQRYNHRSHFNETLVAPHLAGADAVQAMITQAILDGLI